MLGTIFNPIKDFTIQILLQLYQLTGNLGIAIIVLTLLIRFLLVPLSLGSLRSQKKIQDLKPELDKLKKLHGKDKAKFQQAQMELYKKYNINPLSGCLPYLVQIVLLIVLYQVLHQFISQTEINGIAINPMFAWLDLSKPDPLHILPILAGVSQFILSLMISPGAEVTDIVPNDSKKKEVQKANEKEEDFAEMAAGMQKQMLFMMPIMTGFIAWRFQSGLALYWVVTTAFSAGQQYFISGFGGLVSYWKLAVSKVNSFKK
ncbi:MAG: YidC/Oxa1 family membrane protein insertase [Patescibacteria group bacterium]